MTVWSESASVAMLQAVAAADSVRGLTRPNPSVGAVILDAEGNFAGVGATQPPPGPHAEVMALRAAGERARGGTAFVALEPCNHYGRTPPCTQALVESGIAKVVYAVSDPNPKASGGADFLRAAGLEVSSGLCEAEVAQGPLRAWLHRQRTGRCHLTWKTALSLDGRIAAADGSSQWITGEFARAEVHRERAKLDAIIVGTGTVLADDPWLTARKPDGSLAAHQPLRVVVGMREIPTNARVLDDSAETLLLRTRDPHEVIAALRDYPDALLEGGAVLAGAFLAAGFVDRVLAYLAPVVLGDGPAAVIGAGVESIGGAHRFVRESVDELGPDVRLSLVPARDRTPEA